MIVAGFLASAGYFNLLLVILVMIFGDFLSDIMWYTVGYYGGSRILRKLFNVFGIDHDRIEKLKSNLENHTGKILITIKLTTGLCLATMITSGAVKMRLKKFLFFDFIGSVLWSSMVVTLGYFFGESYSLLNNLIKYGGLIAVAVLFLAIIGFRFFNKHGNFLKETKL